MAKNAPTGDGHRYGAVTGRSQVLNPKTDQWVKRDTSTGRFMDVKADGTPFNSRASGKKAKSFLRQSVREKGTLPSLPCPYAKG